MKIIKQHNYYAEDLVPLSTVRDHLRYATNDAEALIRAYVAAACDYMESITNRVFCSSAPAAFHEDPNQAGSLTEIPDPILATVDVYMDEADINKVHYLRGVTGSWSVVNESILYLNDQDQWVSMATADIGVDFTKVYNITETYPITIDWTGAGKPNDLNERGYNVFKVQFEGGDNVQGLPAQYRQAMLLLVGHYDMHREAETVGAVSAEIKEGVHRLLNSVRQY
jgi:hypothetical protein